MKLLAIATAILLLFALIPHTIDANAQQIVQGHFNLFFSSFAGRSNYSIYYQFPKTVSTNSNFTIRITLFVNELSGLKLYISNYNILITLYGNSKAFIRTIAPNTTRFLYEGAHWGPIEATFNLRADEIGSSEKPVNTTISIRFVATVWYELPPNCNLCQPFEPESDERTVGSIMIVPQQSNPQIQYTYLLIAILIALAMVLLLLRLNQKRAKVRAIQSDVKNTILVVPVAGPVPGRHWLVLQPFQCKDHILMHQ